MENFKNLAPLIRDAKAGDQQAMGKLISQFNNLLLKLSKNSQGKFDEDNYQMLCEKFIKAIRKFDTSRF